MASADNLDDHHSAGSFPADPMHQFEISRYFELNLGGLDISFTNSALFMVISVILISFFSIFFVRKQALVPSRMQSLVELFESKGLVYNPGSQSTEKLYIVYSVEEITDFSNLTFRGEN